MVKANVVATQYEIVQETLAYNLSLVLTALPDS